MAFLKETEVNPVDAAQALVEASVRLDYELERENESDKKTHFVVLGKGEDEQYLALFLSEMTEWMANRTVRRLGDLGEYHAHVITWDEVWKYRGVWSRCDCTELPSGEYMIHVCSIPESVLNAWDNA